MIKSFSFILVIIIIILFSSSCKRSPEAEEIPPGTFSKRAIIEPLIKRIIPETKTSGIVKIAIVRNMTTGDYGRQYQESCVAEGRSMGFLVDYFDLNGDGRHIRERILQIALADYDGIIFSLAGEGVAYSTLLPQIDRRIKIVTFDNLPYRDDDPRKDELLNITATAQDDKGLADISLKALVDSFETAPVRVISIIAEPGIPPLDNRYEVYRRYINEGKIIEVASITPPNYVFIRSAIREALIKTLENYPPGSIDAIWAPYDEFAKGCIDALNETGRSEIKLTSIDISSDNIKMMLDNADQWIASAATDPSMAGIINMRLLAAKLAGESVPAAFIFDAYLVETSMLNHSVTMANITSHIPGWPNPQGFFEYTWMTELKEAVAGRRGHGH